MERQNVVSGWKTSTGLQENGRGISFIALFKFFVDSVDFCRQKFVDFDITAFFCI
jgi:hypothetical protein